MNERRLAIKEAAMHTPGGAGGEERGYEKTVVRIPALGTSEKGKKRLCGEFL
jgi:hypothetical protein